MAHHFNMSPEAMEYQAAHINDDKRPATLAILSVLVSLSSIAIFLRLTIRWRSGPGFGADDFCVFIAWILGWAGFVTAYTEMRNGLGTHLIRLTPEQFRGLLKGFIIISLTYQLAVMFTQLSILFLYKRIFTLQKRWFRNTLYVLAILSITCEIAIFFAGLLFCTPIHFAWNKSVKGHCVNVQMIYVFADVLNLLVDFAIVIAPIPLIWSLHMTRSAKWGVSVMFLLGDTDIPVTDWTEAEHHLGIVSACLPCFRPLFHGIHGLLSTHHRTSSSNKASSGRTPQARPVADTYKTLDGKETPMNGSKIALVPCDQWTVPPVLPASAYNPNNVAKTKAVVEGGVARPHDDVELGLSPRNINVTREVDVTRTSKT
ncbi:hypothetical protein MMC22_009763 [Lobaria immixta]|nr:hypothetical protein [Lobaria immixta]